MAYRSRHAACAYGLSAPSPVSRYRVGGLPDCGHGDRAGRGAGDLQPQTLPGGPRAGYRSAVCTVKKSGAKMTLILDLSEELEARLRTAARAEGTDEAEAVRQVLERTLPPVAEPPAGEDQDLTPAQRAEGLRFMFAQ